MNKPQMIIFDFGENLPYEEKLNGVRGTEAVLAHAVRNPHGDSFECDVVGASLRCYGIR